MLKETGEKKCLTYRGVKIIYITSPQKLYARDSIFVSPFKKFTC